MVDCHPTFEKRDCPEDTIYMQNILWGCCPACVKYLEYGETCEIGSNATLAATTEKIMCAQEKYRDLRVMKSSILGNTPTKLPTLKLFQCGPGGHL